MLFLAMASLAGCSGSAGSGGGTQQTNLAGAATLGITNCLTCHNQPAPAATEWLASRHANEADAGTRVLQDAREVGTAVPTPDNVNPVCAACHNPIGDGQLIDQAIVGQAERMLIGCESCHGGGQFHNGVPAGVPFRVPGPDQCGDCHGIFANELFHGTDGNGDNLRRNISDTHDDDPVTTNVLEGYAVKTAAPDGCSGCHAAHGFDLTINLQWARSPHAGHIKDVKDQEMFDQLDAGADGATTLAAVKGVGVTAATGDAWVHYDWDDTNGAGPGGSARGDCQRCHTATGLSNFLTNSVAYSSAANNYSHLAGWTGNPAGGNLTSSGQNEMLYCWGCHSSVKTGVLRNPGALTLDFVFLAGPDQDPAGVRNFVVMPDKGKSNVCGACHSGRGNDTTIRDAVANNRRSTRFAGHHAPTAGSLYAEVVHTGFEFTGRSYAPPAFFLHDDIRVNNVAPETGDGPCVGCHMADTANHNFLAVTEDGAGDITAITNQPLCDTCHGGGVTPAFLNQRRIDFADARQILLDLVDNSVTNYLDADLTQRSDAAAGRPTGFDNAPLEAYGAMQNSLYMVEEPCIYVHNDFYGKRLLFDSIDWLQDGALDGTIIIDAGAYPAAANWLGNGAARP